MHDLYDMNRQSLDEYTVRKLRETVNYVKAKSTFYGRFFSGTTEMPQPSRVPGDAEGFMKWFESLPFTCPRDLIKSERDFLCVSLSEISRIVTLNTGGTTGSPKRIYFTEEDQQLTVDYFQKGMQWIVGKGDKVLILMPAKIPGSIGLLLAEGLKGFGAVPFSYGLPRLQGPKGKNLTGGEGDAGCREEADRLLCMIKKEKINSVVALPTHMKILAELSEGIKLDSVLLSAEYVPEETVRILEKALGCKVFEHYGMTEMGLGCAVSCGKGQGYHIREKDLYVEIIDPKTGAVIEDDRPGEIVFTTLTRKGMPFVRYRTGDRSRWIKEPCSCGSILKRIDRVEDREQIKGYLRNEEDKKQES